MPEVVMYSTRFCPYCVRAKQLLQSKHINFTELRVDEQPELRPEMEKKAQRTSVPQIFVDGRHIGNSDELLALDAAGKLDPLLEGTS